MLRYLVITALWKVLATAACTAAAPCSAYSEWSPNSHDFTLSRLFTQLIRSCCSNHQHARHLRAANRVPRVPDYEPGYP